MKIKMYGVKDRKLVLMREDIVKSGMRLEFHGGCMEKWCKEIIFEE